MPQIETYCAWCGEFLGQAKDEAAQADKVSHGICETCFNKALAEIEEMQIASIKPTQRPELRK